ncbi:MAG TPA: hypothetical protein VEY69_15460 [Lautropia sp.]|nr:hypothetical protein [Lautropia sp.]
MASGEQHAAIGVSDVQVMPTSNPVAFTKGIAEIVLPRRDAISAIEISGHRSTRREPLAFT